MFTSYSLGSIGSARVKELRGDKINAGGLDQKIKGAAGAKQVLQTAHAVLRDKGQRARVRILESHRWVGHRREHLGDDAAETSDTSFDARQQ